MRVFGSHRRRRDGHVSSATGSSRVPKRSPPRRAISVSPVSATISPSRASAEIAAGSRSTRSRPVVRMLVGERAQEAGHSGIEKRSMVARCRRRPRAARRRHPQSRLGWLNRRTPAPRPPRPRWRRGMREPGRPPSGGAPPRRAPKMNDVSGALLHRGERTAQAQGARRRFITVFGDPRSATAIEASAGPAAAGGDRSRKRLPNPHDRPGSAENPSSSRGLCRQCLDRRRKASQRSPIKAGRTALSFALRASDAKATQTVDRGHQPAGVIDDRNMRDLRSRCPRGRGGAQRSCRTARETARNRSMAERGNFVDVRTGRPHRRRRSRSGHGSPAGSVEQSGVEATVSA